MGVYTPMSIGTVVRGEGFPLSNDNNVESRGSDYFTHWRGWKALGAKYMDLLIEAGAAKLDAKEKYGTLRFEIWETRDDANHELINHLENEAEDLSERTCIECGTYSDTVRQLTINSWTSPFCTVCSETYLESGEQLILMT